MTFLTAFAFLAATVSACPFERKQRRSAKAKAKYINKLVNGATATENSQLGRRLDGVEEYEVNISAFSVKFIQCQFVNSYSDEMAQEEFDTVLATMRFVLFRLCPDDCSACYSGFGEYLVDLDSYFEATVEYFQGYQKEMCNACEENCYQQANQAEAEGEDQAAEGEAEDGGRKLQNYQPDCETCWDECQKIQNMEENGYIDATEFLECNMIYDPEDDNKEALYAGPICVSSGTKIEIGVFKDENCMYLDSSKEVDDYLFDNDGVAMKLSHALLKSTYNDTCISCKEPQDADENNNGDDDDDADEVIEMCERLYEGAAKCETRNGFENGYAFYNVYANRYANQVSNEQKVCDFMASLKSGTYNEEGEIFLSISYRGGKRTTGGQKFALTFFILGTVGLAVYAAMLHSKLVKGGKADLSNSGGAMA